MRTALASVIEPNPVDEIFAEQVRKGLGTAGQKTLPTQYLYDDLGSSLFESITMLPEYGLTRAEERILSTHAGDIADAMGKEPIVAELGSGSSRKTRAILERLDSAVYYPIDVSQSALEMASCNLRELHRITLHPIHSGYLDGLREVASRRYLDEHLTVLFLGSTLGNFGGSDILNFLHLVRQMLIRGDGLLLGLDLLKPVPLMLDAYCDSLGVTAAFNRNILTRINRELDADFDLAEFEHVARFDQDTQNMEMHLRCLRAQTVHVRRADVSAQFSRGETIRTERSHKFSLPEISQLATDSGFVMENQWVDEEWPFAETFLRAI